MKEEMGEELLCMDLGSERENADVPPSGNTHICAENMAQSISQTK